ncbi:MAG: acyltransferase family protein [Acetivibrio sp.]
MSEKTITQAEPRFYKFDNLKFILILTVVVGHFCDEYTKGSGTMKSIFIFIYTFHMPLFLFVSGLFRKRQREGEGLRIDKITTYILIGFGLKLLIFFIKLVFHKNPSFKFLSDKGIPWFMFVLVEYEILIFLTQKIKGCIVVGIAIVLGCISGYANWIGDFLYVSRFLVYAPFFLLGYYLNPVAVKNFLQKRSVQIISIFCFLGLLYLCFCKRELIYPYRYLFTGRHPFSIVKIENCSALHRMIAYLITTVSCISVASIVPDVRLPLVTKFGSRTLQVYFWHRPILFVIMYSKIMDPVFYYLPDALCKLLFLMMGVVLTFILSLKVFALPLNCSFYRRFLGKLKEKR